MANANDTLNSMLGSAPAANSAPVPVATQAVNAVLGVSDQKQAAVASAADQKKAEIGGVQPQPTLSNLTDQQIQQGLTTQATGSGANSIPTDIEADAAYLPYQDLANKYGAADALALIGRRNNARQDINNTGSLTRSDSAVVGDSVLGVGQGLINSIGGLAAFGTGLVSDSGGAKVAQATQDASNFLGDYESNRLKGKQIANATANALTGRENKAQEQRDIDAGDSEFVAGLSRFGSDFADGFTNAGSDMTTMLDGTAQAVGSLLTAGPIGKGVSAGIRAVMPANMARIAAVGERAAESGHALPTTAAKAISAIGSHEAGTIAAIGLTEGGGAYQQTVNNIMQMPFSDLQANSPDFAQMTKPVSQGGQGMSQEDARTAIANRAGLMAGAIQAPLAAVTGKLTSKFEMNPFAKASPITVAANALKEKVEEGTQSATGQLNQNLATKTYADKNQDMLDQVGEQSGVGALYGLTSTVAVQAPSVVARAPIDAVKGTYKAISTMASTVAANRQKATDEASPVANNKVQSAASDLHDSSPEIVTQATDAVNAAPDLTDDQKAEANQYVNDVAGALSVNHEAEIAASNDPVLIKAAGQPKTRVELMLNLAKFMSDPANSEQDRLSVAGAYDQQMSMSKQLLSEMPDALKDLPNDHPAKQFLDGVTKLNSIFDQTPAARDAAKAVGDIADNAGKNGLLQPVDPNDLTSPAAQQNILNHMTVAQFAPAKANAEAVNTILNHATNGDIQTTPTQLTALKATHALLDSAKQFDDAAKAQGLTPQDIVGSQIKTDKFTDTHKKSALQYVNDITSAYNSGDLNTATSLLGDFQKFAQHMNNKVVALNTHLETATPNVNSTVTYDALMPDRTFKPSKEGVFVNPRKGSSIDLAKRVGLESKFIGDVVNSLSTAFPDLGVSHVEQTPLDPRLTTGSTKEVVSNFRNGVLKEGKLSSNTVADTAPANDKSGTNENKDTAPKEAPTKTYDPIKDYPVADGWKLEQSKNGAYFRATQTNEDGSIRKVVLTNDGTIKEDTTTPAPVQNDSTVVENQEDKSVNPEPVVNEPAVVDPLVTALDDAFAKMTASPKNADLRADYLKAQKALDRSNDRKANAAQRIQETDENFTDNAETVEPKTKGIQNVYPNLITVNDSNKFTESFDVPKTNAISRLTGLSLNDETPFGVVGSALANREAFTAMSGKDIGKRLTAPVIAAYKEQMLYGRQLVQGVNAEIQKAIAKDKVTPEKMARLDLHTQTGYRLFNLMEQDAEGNYALNEELTQSAALAALQWVNKANQFEPILDEQAVAAILGVNVEDVTLEMMVSLPGFGDLDIGQTLGNMITRYWGVKASLDGFVGYTQGIPTAMATEMAAQLVKAGLLNKTVVRYDAVSQKFLKDGEQVSRNDAGKTSVRDINRYTAPELDEKSPLLSLPDAIDRLVQTEPENVTYFGNDEIKVNDTQLHNPSVKLTAQDKKAVAKMQNTKHYLNPAVVNFYGTVGKDGLVDLFGEGDLSKRILNENHKETLEGRNLSVSAAFDQISALLDEMQSRADDEGIDISELPIRYGFDITKVERAQMRGKQNPQSSKVMREMVMPTWSTLDVNDAGVFSDFMLTLAQALGEKVQNMTQETAVQNTLNKLNGDLAESVAMIQEFHTSGELPASAVQTLKNGFGGRRLAPVEYQAISEYARYLNASTDERNTFKTPSYLEADGMVNGATNATQLLGSTQFSATDIETAERGGLYLSADMSTNQHRTTATDNRDTYQATADITKTLMNSFKNRYSQSNTAISEQVGHLVNLMNIFLPDLSIDDQGNLVIKRGVVKNPLTIKVYGSGLNGIAGNLVDTVFDAIYENMSQAATNLDRDPNLSMSQAMFGNDQEAKFQMYQEALNALTHAIVSYDQKTNTHYIEEIKPLPNESKGLVDFTFNRSEREVVQANMRVMFVDQLNTAITKILGNDVTTNADLVGQITNLKSIYAQAAFNKAVAAKIADHKANTPNYKSSEFLTNRELNDIKASLSHLAPVIHTGSQNFDISSQRSAAIAGTELSRNLDGTSRSSLIVSGYGETGVSGTAFLNIGTGDGKMMQEIYTDPETDDDTLPVFDGQHLRVDRIRQGSLIANRAVAETWKGNTIRAVLNSWSELVPFLKSDFPTENAGAVGSVLKAIFKDQSVADDIPTMLDAMSVIEGRLSAVADGIDARHAAYAQVTHSIDQMAGGATPFVKQGINITGTSTEKAAAMNKLYVQALGNIKAAKATDVGTALTNYGAETASGVKILDGQEIGKLLSKGLAQMNPNQQRALAAISTSKAIDGYSLVHGTPEQLAAWDVNNEYNGAFADPNVKGMISLNGKQIVIVSPSTETVLHELIHAATFEKLVAHYQSGSTKEVTQAVNNLQDLLNEFKALPTTRMDGNALAAYNSAMSTITGIEGDAKITPAMKQAMALNEFMAWGLSNKALSDSLANTKTKVGKFLDAFYAGVKNFFQKMFGTSSQTTDNILTQLQFNTQIVAESQGAASNGLSDTKLMQSSAYGSDQRLVEVNESLDKAIGSYVGANTGLLDEAARQSKVDDAMKLGTTLTASARVGHIFPMTMQEATTFSTVVATLATEAYLDPNALSRADDLYKHVVKNLTPEMLMPENPVDIPSAESIAQNQYGFLMGTEGRITDAQGRSSLLSAFLALSITNDTVRQALAKMAVPKDLLNQEKTLDAAVENVGTNMMDALSRRMSGEGQKQNVRDAMDALAQRLTDTADNREGFYDQYVSPVGGLVDGVNDKIVSLLDTGSSALIAAADKVGKNTNNKYVKATTSVLKVIGAMATEKNGEFVAQGVMQALNRTRAFQPLFDIINDIVGRTASNAVIYDVIKTVRSLGQQVRQQYRERLPQTIAGKFTRELSPQEWTLLHHAMGKSDIASLRSNMSEAEVMNVLSHPTALKAKITALENDIRNADTNYWTEHQAKIKQLANFMMTGETGQNLLRNAYAITQGWFDKVPSKPRKVQGADFQQNVDHLASLYAVQSLDIKQRLDLANLVDSQPEGMGFTMSYLMGQRADEMTKAAMSPAALANHFKGYIPAENQQGVSLIVADDSEYSRLAGMSYRRVADYENSSYERTAGSKGYYFANVESRALFNQGIMQNVRQTAGGVDIRTGYTSHTMVAGRVTDFLQVKDIQKQSRRVESGSNLMPVYNEKGVVVAYERSIDPEQMTALNVDQNLSKQIGVWRGRQVEEAQSQGLNEGLVDRLNQMYTEDMKLNPTAQSTYINIFDETELAKDKVLADAVKLITPQTYAYIQKTFGNDFYVRRDMLNDVFGYRSATVGDAWTGTSRWSPATHKVVRDAAMLAFGNKAYQYAVNSQKFIENLVGNARSIIIVKSVVVPVTNAIGNFYQLAARGVPLRSIVSGTPRKLAEINAYTKARVRHIEAEAELRSAEANNNISAKRRLATEIRTIEDSYKRLSIYPLLAAGEFSAINDNALAEDIDLTSGKLLPYIESQVSKLPKEFQTAGRWALVTKDTPLFKALEKSVEYGDFISKAILYDYLIKEKRLAPEKALARISEEYVNYDRLPGRTRGALEKNGVIWFYNFKLRSAKIALSMIRNNPVHALLSGMAPTPTLFGTVGSPITDNFVTMLADGGLGNSLGVGMAFHAPMLNPWVNLMH